MALYIFLIKDKANYKKIQIQYKAILIGITSKKNENISKVFIMKKVNYFIISIIMIISVSCSTKNQKSNLCDNKVNSDKYGADKYGMKKYVMAFLKKGPNRDQPKAVKDSIQKAHLKNITRMAEEKKLVVAGPFLDDGEIRGIYIFNVSTIKEADELTKTDPAIQAGSLKMELRPWYGSAALLDIYEIHKSLSQKDISDN